MYWLKGSGFLHNSQAGGQLRGGGGWVGGVGRLFGWLEAPSGRRAAEGEHRSLGCCKWPTVLNNPRGMGAEGQAHLGGSFQVGRQLRGSPTPQ